MGAWFGVTAHCTRILKLQKRAARIVLQGDIMTPSEFMFRELNWLPFYKRVNYHKCVLMYKPLNNIAPDYLTERFMKVSETHNRQLRSADNDLLKVPNSRTKYYDNSLGSIHSFVRLKRSKKCQYYGVGLEIGL